MRVGANGLEVTSVLANQTKMATSPTTFDPQPTDQIGQ